MSEEDPPRLSVNEPAQLTTHSSETGRVYPAASEPGSIAHQ